MERSINTKACLIELKKDHPYFYEQVFYNDCSYGRTREGYYLLEPWGEVERELPKDLRRSIQERTVLLEGSKAIELQIFNMKRYLDYHKNKKAKCMRYNLDFIMVDRSLHKGTYKGFAYDVTDKENENYFFTPVMSAAEWRRILNAMLCILKKRYREARAEERKPKPRKPRRVPFKKSMYAAIA
tara:strand:- start:326 stop:877 length:552 start_codon:yes stop_codon:yes gene_type:complete